MSEIFREVDEALTYDRLRTLWQRHRIKIVAMLLLVIVSLAVWQVWQYRERQKHLRSAETFFEIVRKNKTQQTAQNSSQNSSQKLSPASPQELSPQEQQNLQGGYRMLWLFARAKTFIERQEWQQAQQALQAVSDDESLPPLYRGYAQIWQASLDIEQGRLEAAEKRLAALEATQKIDEDTPALQGLALYLQAAILAAQNNKKDALDLLTRARAKENLPPALRQRLQEAEQALNTLNTP